MLDPTHRFTNRVDDYVRYRPGYPAALIATVTDEAGLTPKSTIADIGSGTGISSRPFLDLGCTVFAVEPNENMRAAAERLLAGRDAFCSVNGRAEATMLPDGSVDLVVAGQAFHWFDPDAARGEFRRILRGDGQVALFWNGRETGTAFNRDYEDLVRRVALDRGFRSCQAGGEVGVSGFFAVPPRAFEFPNFQDLDFDGLAGRLTSSSYSPMPGHAAYSPMMAELEELFDRHAEDGRVRFEYRTELFIGRV